MIKHEFKKKKNSSDKNCNSIIQKKLSNLDMKTHQNTSSIFTIDTLPSIRLSNHLIIDPEYDPFINRKKNNLTSNSQTFMHFLKASLGTGILSIPLAFKHSGLFLGIIGILLVALICSHCSYILVKCSHKLYYQFKLEQLSYSDIIELSFTIYNKKNIGKIIKYIIEILLFLAYFGTCCVYMVIITTNMSQILNYYDILPVDFYIISNMQFLSIILLLPLSILICIPNLKLLSIISILSNILMWISLCIILYYLWHNIPCFNTVNYVGNIQNYPQFFAITIFALQAIGIIMPLENNMKTPKSLLGICGLINSGNIILSVIYIIMGFFGYLKYGDIISDNIMLNLPINEIPAQIGKIFITLSVLGTFTLQFYVCYEIFNKYINRVWISYLIKFILIIIMTILIILIPSIEPFIQLVSTICFSILGFIIPSFIEILVFNINSYLSFKNYIIITFGILLLIFGLQNTINTKF